MLRYRRYLVCLLAGGLLASPSPQCAKASPLPAEVRAGRCDDLDSDSLVRAIAAELPHLQRADSPSARFGHARMKLADYAHSTLEPLLAVARRGPVALCAALQHDFALYRLSGSSGTRRGHFSAYFHPVIVGSRSRQGRFQVPLYRRPPDPAAALTTAEILDGGLQGRALELCYVDSLLTALNVHIEGSATVQLDDGSEINLTTDGHNGHPYTNPFKLARQDGIFSAARAESPVKPPAAPKSDATPAEPLPFKSKTSAFFAEHPELLHLYWAKNPHFVFFKETPLRGTGKFGQLIPGRSVAIDATQIPMGAALWLRTEMASAATAPNQAGQVSYMPIARVALAQDTGAAIRGRGRVDVFVGSGTAAKLAAAITSRPGELYLVVKKRPARPARHRRKPRE